MNMKSIIKIKFEMKINYYRYEKINKRIIKNEIIKK